MAFIYKLMHSSVTEKDSNGSTVHDPCMYDVKVFITLAAILDSQGQVLRTDYQQFTAVLCLTDHQYISPHSLQTFPSPYAMDAFLNGQMFFDTAVNPSCQLYQGNFTLPCFLFCLLPTCADNI